MNTQFDSVPATVHGAFAFCGIAAILLPAHPSLQSVFLNYGIPSALVSVLFAVPLLYLAITKQLLSRRTLLFIFLLLGYICWMLARGLTSPAFGQLNFFESVRGIAVLTPLSLLCSLIASRNSSVAAKTIFALAVIAALHFFVLVLIGGAFDEPAGLRSLSDDQERQNYQATSFYFGLAGVATACVALRGRGFTLAISIFGFLFIVTLMGVVGARSSVVALIVSVFAVVALSSPANFVRLVLFVLSVSASIFIMAWLGGALDVENFQNSFIVIDRFLILTDGDDASHRLHLFTSAFLMWTDSAMNFLFGGGLGAFPNFIGETEMGWYPHNFILESLAEGGLVAGLLLFPVLLWLVRDFIKLRFRRSSLSNIYLGGVAIYAVVAYQFMGGIQTFWIPMFFVSLFMFVNLHSKI